MKTTKTLNVAAELHQELKIRAVGAGAPLGDYVEAVIQVGLAHPEKIRQLLALGTKTAPQPETALSPPRESEDG